MSFEPEIRAATHLLAVVENGSHSTAQMRILLEEADSALVYLIFSWLRAHYPPSHSAYDGVVGRIAAVCGASSVVARKVREGEQDSIVAWFEESYRYRDLRREDFIPLIVEKLEG
jgi:hypothetical protein